MHTEDFERPAIYWPSFLTRAMVRTFVYLFADCIIVGDAFEIRSNQSFVDFMLSILVEQVDVHDEW